MSTSEAPWLPLVRDAGASGCWLVVAGPDGAGWTVARTELTAPLTVEDLTVLVVGRDWPSWAAVAALVNDARVVAAGGHTGQGPYPDGVDRLRSGLLAHSVTGASGLSLPDPQVIYDRSGDVSPGTTMDPAAWWAQVVAAFVGACTDIELAAALRLLVDTGDLPLAASVVAELM